MEVRKWDFFVLVPEEWIGAFDIVHVRPIVAAFRDMKQPKLILEMLVSMLSKVTSVSVSSKSSDIVPFQEPGGCLQWDEYEDSPTNPVIAYQRPTQHRES
jgi:hypothetical protein